MRFNALVLDLDGTLIDSAADLADVANRLLSDCGRSPLTVDQVRAMIGDGIGALVARAFAATGAPADQSALPSLSRAFLAHYLDPTREHVARVFPGVEPTLRGFVAAGVRLGVCTNKAQAATEMVLAETGLAPLFDAVVGQDAAPAAKPDPAHVQAVLSALGQPAAAAMVGDSGNDLAAGRAAGLPVVMVTYGYGRAQDIAMADARVDTFADLPAVLAAL